MNTVWEWLGITDNEYDELAARARVSHKCVKPTCHTRRYNLQDNLCPKHREAFNKWEASRLVADKPKTEA